MVAETDGSPARPGAASPRFDFSGKRVLVTGASRGIGLGVARGFAAASAELYILADDEGVYEAARSLERQFGAAVTPLRCDIAAAAALHRLLAPLGRIDVLVNNAGVELRTPIGDPQDDVDARFRRVVEVNIVGTWNATRAARPLMGGGGRIIVTSSIWGKVGEPGFAAYSASKHALLGMVRTLAGELGPCGISVNAVCPGWVRTDASMRSLHAMAADSGKDADALLEQTLAGQALAGLMEPEDMADTYLFLASDAARNITGQAFTVDRGEVMV